MLRPSLTLIATLFALSCPAVVDGIFMDMYDKLFQIELLDDCSVYIYDRIVFIPDTKDRWCHLPKSNMNSGATATDASVESTWTVHIKVSYVDDDNIVKARWVMSDGDVFSTDLVSQDYFEAVKEKKYKKVKSIKTVEHAPSEYGRHILRELIGDKDWYNVVYEACKYGKTSTSNFANHVEVDRYNDYAKVTKQPDCDPNVMAHYPAISYRDRKTNVTVYVDPAHPEERKCTVGNMSLILRPIKQSMLTNVLSYNIVKNFSQSFPIPYAKPIQNFEPELIGAIKTEKGIQSFGSEFEVPKIEEDYTEQPFFFYDATAKKYSPLFLYYKSIGTNRLFSIRFVSNKTFYDVFSPMDYMTPCNFSYNNLAVKVAAAPRVIRQNAESISIEVYFFLNSVEFQYCALEVDFKYSGSERKVSVKERSDINAYVHVQQRSTTAANCDFGGRTVRWLLAYSTNHDAELVSLDNSPSSPIFVCSHCGAMSKMYCDINPEVGSTYHSAVYIQTLIAGATNVTYVRIKNERNYELMVETYDTTLPKEYYFVQTVDLNLELHEWKVRLDKGAVDEDYYSTWLDAGNSYSSYWWLLLFALVFLI